MFWTPIEELCGGGPLLRLQGSHQCDDLALLIKLLLEAIRKLLLLGQIINVDEAFHLCAELTTHLEQDNAGRIDIHLLSRQVAEQITSRIQTLLLGRQIQGCAT